MPHNFITNAKTCTYLMIFGIISDLRLYKSARDETFALTEEIEVIEAEIDARVKSLYGVG